MCLCILILLFCLDEGVLNVFGVGWEPPPQVKYLPLPTPDLGGLHPLVVIVQFTFYMKIGGWECLGFESLINFKTLIAQAHMNLVFDNLMDLSISQFYSLVAGLIESSFQMALTSGTFII